MKQAQFTPHIDTGDYVIVINAEKIAVTGKKLEQKMYYHHSDYVGGMKEVTLKEKLEKTNDVAAAAYLGTVIAKKAQEAGIKSVVFDRGGFIYQGKIQALADAAREAGLEF